MFILQKKNKVRIPYLSLTGIFFSGIFILSAGAAEKPLFSSPDVDVQVEASVDPTVMREKFITINTSLLQPSLDSAADGSVNSLTFDFFGKPLIVILDKSRKVGRKHTSWIGHIKDSLRSQVILVLGENGIVQGNITDGNKKYHIRYIKHTNGKAIHSFQQIDQTRFPQDHPEGFEIGGVLPDQDNSKNNNVLLKKNTNTQNDWVASADALTEQTGNNVVGSGSLIDVMVLYTSAAATEVGGTAAMETKIALAITETNQGYEASGIAQRMNLVHSEQVTYTQTNDMNLDLKNLANETDASNPITVAPTLRNTYKADLVSLFVTDSGYNSCGLGYVGPGANAAFQVVAQNCATGYYSFAHEFAHNQGALHNRENASTATDGDGKYQYGYRYNAGSWRTIMAYNDTTNCAELPSGQHSCIRQNFWSNPDKTFNGIPTGIISTAANAADNRKWMNDTAYTVTNNSYNNISYNLPNNQWHQISVPYAPPSSANTVADVFGAVVALGTVNVDWAIYKFDGANYVALGINDIIEQGIGYWIMQISGSTVTISLSTASTETPVLTLGAECPSSSGCFKTAVLETSTTAKWSMLGNPFPQKKQIKGIVVDSTYTDCSLTNGCSFDGAAKKSQISDTVYHYNPSTATYDSLTSVDYLKPWAGFWFATLPAANGTSPKLLFPSNVQR
jgi:hypothetical protein